MFRLHAQFIVKAGTEMKEDTLPILNGDDSVNVNSGPFPLPKIKIGILLKFKHSEKFRWCGQLELGKGFNIVLNPKGVFSILI